MEYRKKLLPALEAVLSIEGGAENTSKYDLFCWITENDVVFSQLQEAVSFFYIHTLHYCVVIKQICRIFVSEARNYFAVESYVRFYFNHRFRIFKAKGVGNFRREPLFTCNLGFLIYSI